jgi:hypothetical protein
MIFFAFIASLGRVNQDRARERRDGSQATMI